MEVHGVPPIDSSLSKRPMGSPYVVEVVFGNLVVQDQRTTLAAGCWLRAPWVRVIQKKPRSPPNRRNSTTISPASKHW